MTRETRIGLLVGLLFIIMFGLVLSELASTNGPAEVEGRDLISSGAIEDVVTRYSDLPSPPSLRDSGPMGPTLAMSPAPGGRSTPTTMPASPAAPFSPQAWLTGMGSPDAPVRSVPVGFMPPGAGAAAAGAPPVPPPPAPERTYTVQAGDTLTRIARKVYGQQHEREYKRILEANKKVIKDETKLAPNQVLTIPPLPGQTPLPASPAGPPAPPVRTGRAPTAVAADLNTLKKTLESSDKLVQVQPPGAVVTDAPKDAAKDASADAAASAKPGKKYVTRQGDNLTKIAREMLKDSSTAGVQKLLDANKSRIRDPKRIPVGLELEIPS